MLEPHMGGKRLLGLVAVMGIKTIFSPIYKPDNDHNR